MWPVSPLAISQSISRPQPKNVSIMLSPATTTSSRIESIEPEQQQPQQGSRTVQDEGVRRAIPQRLNPDTEPEPTAKPKSQGNQEQFSIATATQSARPGSEAGLLSHGLFSEYFAPRPFRWSDRRTRIPAAGRLWKGREPPLLHQAAAQPPAPLQLWGRDLAAPQRREWQHGRRQPVRPGAPQSAADQERGRLRKGNPMRSARAPVLPVFTSCLPPAEHRQKGLDCDGGRPGQLYTQRSATGHWK